MSCESSYGSLQELEVLVNQAAIAVLGEGTPHFNFKDVTFSYPTRPKKNVLGGFDLSIRQGETVALVGPSGGGRYCLSWLLFIFLLPFAHFVVAFDKSRQIYCGIVD
jgi:ABC-type multidrug transport system fused ATPase/permease subunit